MSAKSTIHKVLLLSLFIFSLASSQAMAVPEVWVDNNYGPTTPGWGVTHFNRIQAGIDALDPGGTAHVYEGVYNENVLIGKHVTLTTDGRVNVIIDANFSGRPLTLVQGAEFTEIRGFTARRSGDNYPDCGVLINNADDITLADCTIHSNLFGIICAESSNQTYSNIDITSCEFYGIYMTALLGDVGNITIADSFVSSTDKPLFLSSDLGYGYENVEISGSRFENTMDDAILIDRITTGTITGNTFEGSTLITEESQDIVVSNNRYINPYSSYSLTFEENCEGIEITDNWFEGGIVLKYDSHTGTISRNYFTYRGSITAHPGTHDFLIDSNMVINNDWWGVQLFGSRDCIIQDNYIQSYFGVYIRSTSENNIVTRNTVVNCVEDGIEMSSKSSYNTITENIIAGNGIYGIEIPSLSGCKHNKIYNNFLYNNAGGNARTHNLTNQWDNGELEGGNYWDDYTGEDLDHDGFGDTPHAVFGGGFDNYPLMQPVGGGALWPDSSVIPASTGASIALTVHGGAENANRSYIILGSLSGAYPGFALPGGHATLPLNWDSFTDLVLANLNSTFFPDFLGTLDATGTAGAEIHFGPVNPFWVGTVFHFAYTCNNPFDVASNPIAIKIVE